LWPKVLKFKEWQSENHLFHQKQREYLLKQIKSYSVFFSFTYLLYSNSVKQFSLCVARNDEANLRKAIAENESAKRHQSAELKQLQEKQRYTSEKFNKCSSSVVTAQSILQSRSQELARLEVRLRASVRDISKRKKQLKRLAKAIPGFEEKVEVFYLSGFDEHAMICPTDFVCGKRYSFYQCSSYSRRD
jgi:chromosome segregation ATPase